MKKKFNFGFVISMILNCAFGAYAGATIGFHMVSMSPVQIIFDVITILVAFFAQLILHEGGHLIFGLLTGYRFLSFRVGNIMLKKTEKGLVFTKFSLAGTAGQCLLAPPELVNETIPFFLYNAGGVIINILTGIFFHMMYLFTGVYFFMYMALCGFLMGLTNGIPMNTPQVSNDGYNIVAMMKDKSAIKAFWLQLYINALQLSGTRLKDIDAKYFEYPTDIEMQNSMHATCGVFVCNYLMSSFQMEKAKETIRRTLNDSFALNGIHRVMLKSDLIYCLLYLNESQEEIEKLYDKNQKKMMKQLESIPSVLRTEYVLEKYLYNNAEKAQKIKEKFRKTAEKYPYQSDLMDEYMLLAEMEKKEDSYATV